MPATSGSGELKKRHRMTTEPESPTRILIAEDDPVSRRVLEVFLIKRGYEVTTVGNGTEAPRLAVLDWMMPGMEGIQVCQRVRSQADRPYVYMLLLTARSQKEDLLQGLEAGADDYLTKPFDPQELHARLKVGHRILDLQDNLIQAREELRFRATHDGLTNIPNRGVVLETLKHEQSRQLRAGGSFGVIMVDLDHFKQINDTHGHACGDSVLQEVARRMKSSIRDYDTVGRYGGEEFLIVIPESDTQGTMSIAERIRTVIESEPFLTQEAELRVTASLGVAVSTASKPIGWAMLLRLADEALYRAKELGRNRSEVFLPPMNACSDVPTVATIPFKPE
jgi:two-component system, cell cycle response regulator